jgi:lysozyme family protein
MLAIPNGPEITPDRFPACLAETLKWEGGWSNDAHDPGGPTMRGIIQRVYDGYRDSRGLPRRSVRLIAQDELEEIYRHNYWNMVRGSELPAGLDLGVFDFCVNSGPSQAIKSLQRVLGVVIDGHLGEATMAALRQRHPADLARAYLEERRRFLRNLKNFRYFGRGWLSRCDGIETACLGMAEPIHYAAADDLPPAEPHPDENVQSSWQGRAYTESPAPPVATEAALTLGGTGGVTTGVANAFAKLGSHGQVSFTSVLLTFLSEPMILLGLVTLIGGVFTYLWRRRHA